MNPNDCDETGIKIILIGEQAVGKSSLLMRYCDNNFALNMIGTAGVDFRKKLVKVDDKEIKLTIFDTAGQQRFRSITKHFYQGAKGIILVYDASDKATFDKLKDWIKTIKDNADDGVETILVANKIDLERQVSIEDGKNFSNEVKIPVVETSAKSGLNVDRLYETLMRNIVKKDSLRKEIDNEKIENDKRIVVNIQAEDKGDKKKANGCCSG